MPKTWFQCTGMVLENSLRPLCYLCVLGDSIEESNFERYIYGVGFIFRNFLLDF